MPAASRYLMLLSAGLCFALTFGAFLVYERPGLGQLDLERVEVGGRQRGDVVAARLHFRLQLVGLEGERHHDLLIERLQVAEVVAQLVHPVGGEGCELLHDVVVGLVRVVEELLAAQPR